MSTKWWQEAIIYQIYPKSFYDSNADSIGDIAGITLKLDYLKSLGINTLWLNPIFISPQVDDGYDVSNYYAIDPVFGSEQEIESLIKAAHELDLKVIFDLVINHTSSQHPWFQEALKGRDNIYRDYYLWQPGDKQGQLPNNWASFFGGSVWEQDELSSDYYFHLFAKEMPDLNWQNPEVRHSMLDIAKYWLSKGVDGFRLDAFIHLAKADFNLQVQGLAPGEVGLAEDYYANLPAVKEYLAEFISELKKIKPDLFILGEAASATPALGIEYTDNENNQCDAIVSFRYFPEKDGEKVLGVPPEIQKKRLDLPAFKARMASWQKAFKGQRLPTLYWNNHDLPRAVSRFGDEGKYRNQSAKMLATLMYLQRGIPIILYGEEIGMKNLEIKDLSVFQNPKAKADYQEMRTNGLKHEVALKALTDISKEASRGVMQWKSLNYGGFSKVEPWSGVNLELAYNVAAQEQNPKSILNYYREVCSLKRRKLFVEGSFELLATSDTTYVYRRSTAQEQALVCLNFSSKPTKIKLPIDFKDYQVMLTNQEEVVSTDQELKLSSYGAIVLINKLKGKE